MPDGVESGYQPTENEQSIINQQMSAGSAREKASADREEWHLSAELNNPVAVNDILALQYNRIPDAKNDRSTNVFVGKVQGHSIQLQSSPTEDRSNNKYMGHIDGNQLDESDAKKIFNQFLTIQEGAKFIDPGNIRKIESNDEEGSAIAKKAAEDIFGSKKS